MTIIVTGAASGIGWATALRLAKDERQRTGRAARIVIVDTNQAGLGAVAEILRRDGAEAEPLTVDLGDPAAPQQIVDAATKRFGGLDVVVSNAGVVRPAPLMELTLADYESTFAVNTRATWLLAKAAYSALKQSQGCLIATASISAEEATAVLGAYSASKSALLMLVRQLSDEWGPEGIRCNCVSPGATHTGMTDRVYSDPEIRARRSACIPLRRIGTPEDIAAAISFLAGPDARYITGANLTVDGGLTNAFMPLSRGPVTL